MSSATIGAGQDIHTSTLLSLFTADIIDHRMRGPQEPSNAPERDEPTMSMLYPVIALLFILLIAE